MSKIVSFSCLRVSTLVYVRPIADEFFPSEGPPPVLNPAVEVRGLVFWAETGALPPGVLVIVLFIPLRRVRRVLLSYSSSFTFLRSTSFSKSLSLLLPPLEEPCFLT